MPDPPRDPLQRLLPLSPTDFHLLLVLADGETYGYALMKAIEAESGGVITPEIGSLYRMLARLVDSGLVVEAGDRVPDDDASPGRPRRYYRITALGREAILAESERLRSLLHRVDDGGLASAPIDS